MPRRPNDRPTIIYWLFDVRSETIAEGWSNGKPFYCGKTVSEPEKRLAQHRLKATTNPHGKVSEHINACGECVCIRIVEVVPAGGDWVSREKRWIWLLRGSFSGATNVSDGGAGAPGYVHTAEARAKIGIAARNRSPETLAKISAGSAGNKHRLGQKHPTNVRLKMSASHAGKKKSADHRASLSRSAKNRSRETLTKISNALKGNTNAKGKKKSAISIAKRTVTRKANRTAIILGLSS